MANKKKKKKKSASSISLRANTAPSITVTTSNLSSTPNPNAIKSCLLAKGYFPREIPPCFTFKNSLTQIEDKSPILHELNQRTSRTLTIIHPTPFEELCEVIDKHWEEILKFFDTCYPDDNFKSLVIDQSFQKFDAQNTDSRMFPKANSLTDYKKSRGLHGGVLLKLDVLNFYESIYTHSIPWALHGKETAKKNHSTVIEKGKDGLYGNDLDKAVRNCVNMETKGIPVGPESSNIIAEIILAAVDLELRTKLLENSIILKGFRMVDDYELELDKDEDAVLVKGILKDILRNFKLKLNDPKTSIQKLPTTILNDLKYQLSYLPKENLEYVYDTLVRLKAELTENQVISYFIKMTYGKEIFKQMIEKMPELAACLMIMESPALRLIDDYQYIQKNKDIWEKALTTIIRNSVKERAANDLAWAVFICQECSFSYKLEKKEILDEIVSVIYDRKNLNQNQKTWLSEMLTDTFTNLHSGESTPCNANY